MRKPDMPKKTTVMSTPRTTGVVVDIVSSTTNTSPTVCPTSTLAPSRESKAASMGWAKTRRKELWIRFAKYVSHKPLHEKKLVILA